MKSSSITASEFVQRLHRRIQDGRRCAFVLGAGCSKSSGIPTENELVQKWSSQLVREGWNRGNALANQRAGTISGADYVNMFKTLHSTERERQKELERICAERTPGFAYVTLAMLATDSRYRTTANLILTTNFDDLIGDAFHLYTDVRPRIFPHELARIATINDDRPTIIKLHSDQHLELADEWRRHACTSLQTQKCLRHLLVDRDLIFVGHSGNEVGICKVLPTAKKTADPTNIYWVNDRAPGGNLSNWLSKREHTWVNHLDFDHLMLLAHTTFGLCHPGTTRTASTVEKYAASLVTATQPFARARDDETGLDLYRALEIGRDTEYRDALDSIDEFRVAEWHRHDSDKRSEYQKHPTLARLTDLIEHTNTDLINKATSEARIRDLYIDGTRQFPHDIELRLDYAGHLNETDSALAEEQLRACFDIDPNHEEVRELLGLNQVAHNKSPSHEQQSQLTHADATHQATTVPSAKDEPNQTLRSSDEDVLVPALDLQNMSLLLGGAPSPTTSATQPKRASAKRLTSERLRFLVVASEWSSVHGGLSTFNRLLCGALAKAGHDVSCLVPAATEGECINAARKEVKLFCATRTAVSEEMRLFLKPTLELPPDVVVGHGRVTGEAAHVQSRDSFPGSTLVHFVHTSPEHIEWFKGDTVAGDASRKADARQDNEIRMCKQADLPVGVGPRLTDHIKNKILSGDGYVMPIHRLDPGLTDISPITRQPTRPHCILLARAEDRRLKGIDIALRALDGYNPKNCSFLMIRGVPEGQTEEFWGWARSLARNVDVRPFAYSADEDKVAANIRESSLVLMPSREEGFGLVGLEAISAGVPVLISGNSGLGEMLSDQRSHSATRAVVEMSGNDDTDIETWRVKIGNILHNREAAYEDARTLRGELASVLNWDTAVEKLVAALREASKGNPTSDAS